MEPKDQVTFKIEENKILYYFRGNHIFTGEFGAQSSRSDHILLVAELRKRYGYGLAEAWGYVKTSPQPPKPPVILSVVDGKLIEGRTYEDCNSYELVELYEQQMKDKGNDVPSTEELALYFGLPLDWRNWRDLVK
jgi:hypothetical protein